MGEHKCVVSYCCCGCSLRSGSLAIGVTVLILSLLGAIYNIYEAIKYGTIHGWISFVINLLVVIVSALLIQGIQKDRRSYVMTWVWTMVVLIIVNIISAIIILISAFDIVAAIITLIIMAIFIYLVVVVRSYGLSMSSSPTMA